MKAITIFHKSIPDSLPESSACIGYFDGVHKGHQELLKHAVKAAEEKGLVPALITFDPDPSMVLNLNPDPSHLSSIDQRIELAEQFGIRQFYLIRFTRELADLSPEAFIEEVLIPLKVRHLVCGFDFSYGRFGKGRAEDLSKDSRFSTDVIPEIRQDGDKISSTRIEKAVREGDMAAAESLLGYPYTMTGTVVAGRKKGRTIGYPTANIRTDVCYVLPSPGVYAGIAEAEGERYAAMINLGHNSRFNYYDHLSFEVHLLDFEGDLYGRPIRIEWGKKIREELVFEDMEQLRRQLVTDEKTIRQHFQSGPVYDKIKGKEK